VATDVASRCIESVITQSLIVLSKSQLAQTVTRFNEDVIKTEWRRQQYRSLSPLSLTGQVLTSTKYFKPNTQRSPEYKQI